MAKAANTDEVQQRVHSNPGSKGSQGKSLETEARASWCDARGVPWGGTDLDDRHRTFSSKHPSDVRMYKLGNDSEANETFQVIFRGILQQKMDVHLIDTRAQMDELFTKAIEGYDFLELCRERGIRMTQFMFPSDEVASMENFTELIKFGAGLVDFVIVDNPAKTRGKLFYGSRLHRTMQDLGAQTIRMPIINYSTLRVMEIAENKAGRGIPLAEFASAEAGHLDIFMIREIQSVLAKMYAQYDAIADLLVPTARVASIKAAAEARGGKKKAQMKEGYQLNFQE